MPSEVERLLAEHDGPSLDAALTDVHNGYAYEAHGPTANDFLEMIADRARAAAVIPEGSFAQLVGQPILGVDEGPPATVVIGDVTVAFTSWMMCSSVNEQGRTELKLGRSTVGHEDVQEYTRTTNPCQEEPRSSQGHTGRGAQPVKDFDAMSNPTVAAWSAALEPAGDAQLYLQYEVGVAGVVALAERAMPKFVEVDGLVLVESQYDEVTFAEWQESLGDDRAALARTVNHFVVWDELNAEGERDDHSDDMVAEFIAACWRAKAAADFPGRNIIVEVIDQYGPTVVMYEPNDHKAS